MLPPLASLHHSRRARVLAAAGILILGAALLPALVHDGAESDAAAAPAASGLAVAPAAAGLDLAPTIETGAAATSAPRPVESSTTPLPPAPAAPSASRPPAHAVAAAPPPALAPGFAGDEESLQDRAGAAARARRPVEPAPSGRLAVPPTAPAPASPIQ